jgi:C4-dicarboxylate-specific signal transduction histidine kinase
MSNRVNDITTNIHRLMRSSLGPRQQFPVKDAVASAIWLATQGNPSAVRVTWHENTKETILNGHSTLIQQAIMNLLSNAIKYTSRSGIPDERPSIDLLISKNRLIIKICNRLAAADLHKIPVEIGNPYNSGSEEGLGIGLQLTRTIAKEHGGNLKHDVSPENWFRAELSLPTASHGEQL